MSEGLRGVRPVFRVSLSGYRRPKAAKRDRSNKQLDLSRLAASCVHCLPSLLHLQNEIWTIQDDSELVQHISAQQHVGLFAAGKGFNRDRL